MLEVDLLGPPEVTIDGSPIRVDTRKAIALLAYLVVEKSATRDALAGLFWSESSSQRARATLRRTLSVLRAAVGPGILNDDRHRVAVSDRATVDVWRFQDSTRIPSSHDHDRTAVCANCIPQLQAASEVYRGDFLEGFSVRGAPDFEQWARTVAESFRMRAGEAFRRLAMAHAGVGDYEAAIGAAGRWVALDRLHEPAYRHLMLMQAWAGDRPGSIETYRRCVAFLDQELGVSPLQETSELYEAILDEDLPSAPAARDRVTPKVIDTVAAKDLLDRDEELGLLNEALGSVPDRGQVVGLTGRSWMGKTRLIEEFVGSLPNDRAISAVGRASRGERSLPYGVVVQVLRELAPHLRADEQPEWVLAEVGRLVPQLSRRDGDASSSDPFGELRLFHAVETLLGTLSEGRVLVIAIDDAQWLDPASASLLAYLRNRISTKPILLLIAHGSDTDLTEPPVELLAEPDTVIELQPLTVEQVARVAREPAEADSIVQRTGGIPFLVTELLSGGHAPDGESPGVIKYLESRIRDLSELARQVLGAAAALSGACHASLLREVSGRAEEELVEAVEELVAAGLLRELPNSDELRFTLDALERVTYGSMSLIRRRLLHRRAAAALATRPRAETDPQTAAAVAAQHQASGSAEAADWYRRAGDLASALYAYAEARDFYEKAIALGSLDAGGLRLRLGEVEMATGDYDSALHHLNAAAAHLDAADLGLVEHHLGDVQRLLGRFDLAEEHFTRASVAHPTPASLYADWALLRHRIGDAAGALELAQRSLQLAEETNDDGQRSRAHNILGVVASDDVLAQRSFTMALRLAGDDDQLRMAALNNQAHLVADSGDLDGAVKLVEEAIAIARRTGYRHREAAVRNHLADLHHLAGREEASRQALTSAISLFADVGAGGLQPEVWLLSEW